MRVLVIDTALDACTAAVVDDGRILAEISEPMARGHQERIGVIVREVVTASGGFDRLDRIGVTVGPGSFTGLRVGLSFAQGLGAALDCPVLGLSTLEALATRPETEAANGAIAAVIDARRGQVYLQVFDGGGALGPPAPWDVIEARDHLEQAGVRTLIGSGASLVAGPHMDIRPGASPSVRAMATLTTRRDPAEDPPRPLYLRAPDATPPTRLPGQARPRVAS